MGEPDTNLDDSDLNEYVPIITPVSTATSVRHGLGLDRRLSLGPYYTAIVAAGPPG